MRTKNYGKEINKILIEFYYKSIGTEIPDGNLICLAEGKIENIIKKEIVLRQSLKSKD